MGIRFTEHGSVLRKRLWLDRLCLNLPVAVAFMGIVGFASPRTVSAAPADPNITITVRVYDYAQASPIILASAEREAGRIFGEAGLKVVWLDCTPQHATAVLQDCQKVIEAEDLRLRILLTPISNILQNTDFGFAITPALASVYYKSAVVFAKNDEEEFETPMVLGCAIAHEIGHLLLGSNSHSASGIMSARWEREHIRLALMGAMLFTSGQARHMQAEMQRRATLRTPRPTNASVRQVR